MTSDSAPKGWKRARYGDALAETEERAGERTFLPVLSVTKTRGPMLASERFGKTMHGRNLSRYRVAPRDHIVADPMLLWDGSIGVQEVVDAGLVSPDYRVYKATEDASPSFMAYLVRSPLVQSYYQGGARGTNVRRNRIARSDFLSIPLSLPPLSEQRKIAAILSSVDDAIEATQAVIDQLQVVKKAMMAELLTRGLPARHTCFKQTEIGELPDGWDILPLQAIADGPANGRSPLSKATPPGVPTFSIAAIRDGRVNIFEHIKYADVSPSEVANFVLSPGDVLVVRGNGNEDLVGKCGVVEDAPEGCIYPDILMRVRPHDLMSLDYFVTTWNSDIVHDQVLDRAKTTNGTYKINGQDVRSILLPVPPRGEQEEIGAVLASIESARRGNEGELQGLWETRSALMSVLLTGEVRVAPDEAAA